MDNLESLSNDLTNLFEILKYFDLPMTNGVNTLSSHIDFIKSSYQKGNFDIPKNNDYFYSKNLKANLEKYISIDFIARINYLINHDNFNQEWIKLNTEEKKNIIFFDKNIYPLLRQKLNTSDFNFMFSNINTNLDNSPHLNVLSQWCKIPEGQKISFFKLRKSAEKTEYKDFFHLPKILYAEEKLLNKQNREKIVIEYLNSKNKLSLSSSNISWYNRLDMTKDNDYIYTFLRNMEDDFNGYTQIKENIELPSLLKTWVGLDINLKEYEQAILEFEKSCLSLSDKELKKRNKEHPSNLLRIKIESGITSEELLKLKEQAKGGYMEEFFNLTFTEQMRTEMPYKRQDYMFVYFRDVFMKNTKKFKP